MAHILKDGSLKEIYAGKIDEHRINIQNVRLNNEHGIRMNAVIEMYHHTHALMNLCFRILIESGVELKSFSKPSSHFHCVKLDEIKEKVNEFFGVDIMKKTRKREVVIARQTCHMLCKMFTPHSLKMIGELTGGYDHTTILHSIQTIKDLLDTDEIFYEQFNTIAHYFREKLNKENNANDLSGEQQGEAIAMHAATVEEAFS